MANICGKNGLQMMCKRRLIFKKKTQGKARYEEKEAIHIECLCYVPVNALSHIILTITI